MPVGNLVLPDPADVRVGVGYGANGTEFVGTYAPDYPAVGNVRLGTSYNFGALVGTLLLPTESTVLIGVQYGAGGTEFVGAAFVASYPTGVYGMFLHDREQIVQQLLVDRGLGTDPAWWANHTSADRGSDASHDWPVRYGSEGDDPDESVTVYETTPVFQAKIQTTGEVMQNWGITVRVRGRSSRAASAKADAIRVDLDQQCIDRTVTLDGTRYFVQSFPRTTMTKAMRADFGSRTLWVVNLNCLAVILTYPLSG